MKYLLISLLFMTACASTLPTPEQNFKMVTEVTCDHYLRPDGRLVEFNQCVNTLASKAHMLEFKVLKKYQDKE